MLRVTTLTTLVFIVLLLVSCGQGNNTPDNRSAESVHPADIIEEQPVSNEYQAAEMLAKRAILYKLAFQEGDLAVFTAMPESLEGLNIPAVPVRLNSMWWTVEWDSASLAPLPSTVITGLESVVFPLIASELAEADDENGWVLFALAYDPDLIKTLIANAHTEWIPEEREIFLSGILESCLQVWCAEINGEWKLLSHLPCQDDVEVPEVPEPPAELFEISAGETEGIE